MTLSEYKKMYESKLQKDYTESVVIKAISQVYKIDSTNIKQYNEFVKRIKPQINQMTASSGELMYKADRDMVSIHDWNNVSGASSSIGNKPIHFNLVDVIDTKEGQTVIVEYELQ